jgi:hypothetical protein
MFLGRRGYDLMGQVVFYGVSYKRIRQLLSSRVPQLRGGFPLSASLTLRLIMLQNSGASSKELIDAQAKKKKKKKNLFCFVLFSSFGCNDNQVEQLLNQPLLSQEGINQMEKQINVFNLGQVNVLNWTVCSNITFPCFDS